MFTPLLVHSEFSPGFGSLAPERLVQRAAELGFPAIALTDVENLRGQVRFHHAARAWGLHAITGVTMVERGQRLIVLARDEAGYEALCSLVTRRSLEGPGEHWAHVDFENQHLVFISDDPTLKGRSRWLAASGSAGVACPEIVLVQPSDAERHALRCAIHAGAVVSSIAVRGVMPDATELRATFDRAALEETVRIAESCTLDLTRRQRSFPQAAEAGRALAEFAWTAERARPPDQRRAQRLAEELGLIERLGFSAYFFLVAEIVDAATELGISVAARGSVVSSLTGHLLGLSPVDPLAEGLLFERFLHEARTRPPDIDLDVPSERREELIAWTLRHLGQSRAARIGTHVTFQRRSAWRAGLAAYGMGRKELDALAASMPPGPDWSAPPRLQGAFARVTPFIESLIGCYEHGSAHPGGLVVTPERLSAHTALERASSDAVVTQFDAQGLEALGLFKVNLLGSRALSVIDEAQRWVAEVHVTDEARLEALRAGDTLGVAQVESPMVRSTLQALPLATRSELTAALAVVRPGPGAGNARTDYVAKMNSGESAEDVPLYDEDLIRLIAATTRLPLGDADALRTRVIHGEATEVRKVFVEHARAAGRPDPAIDEAWRLVERFAASSFSKAHAASTAWQAWTALGLKLEHPSAFACAVLNHDGGAYPLRTLAADFQRRGVELRLPCVNTSQPGCTLEGNAVRLGLSRVKHLRAQTAMRILENRPFYELSELFAEVPMTRSEREALVWSGACDSLPPLDAESYPLVHEDVLARLTSRQPLTKLPQRRLGGEKADVYRGLTRVKHELETLGVHVSAHPLAVLRPEAHRTHCIQIAHLHGWAGRRVRFAGLVAASHHHRTEAGRELQFVTFEDETGLVEVTLSSNALAHMDPISSPGPWLLEGLVEGDGRAVRVQLIAARPFHKRAA